MSSEGWNPFDGLPEVLDGRFTLGEQVGDGGAGVVYSAIDRVTGQTVAIKVVEKPALSQPVRFIAEIKDLARLDHPHIVQIRAAGREGAWYWYAMPYYAAGSLHACVLREGAVAPSKALRWTFEMLLGLDYLHRAQLIHRDVKPHNVLLGDAGQAMLSDFGLVKHLGGDVPFHTTTGESMGSPGYRAPEQARDPASADLRADLYGVGGTLYFLLTGKRPGFFYMLEPDEATERFADIPVPVREVILKATAHPATKRYASDREMAEAVCAAHDQLPATPATADAWMREFDPPPPSLWARLRTWLSPP